MGSAKQGEQLVGHQRGRFRHRLDRSFIVLLLRRELRRAADSDVEDRRRRTKIVRCVAHEANPCVYIHTALNDGTDMRPSSGPTTDSGREQSETAGGRADEGRRRRRSRHRINGRRPRRNRWMGISACGCLLYTSPSPRD